MDTWLKNRSLGNLWTILNLLGQMHTEPGAHNYRNKAFPLKTQCPLAHPLNSLSGKKKSTITFVLCWLSDVGPGAALRCGSHTQWGAIGEKQFKSGHQLEITSGLGTGLVSTLSLCAGTAFGLDLFKLCVPPQPLCVPMCTGSVVSGRHCFSDVFYLHWTYNIFPCSSDFPEL